MLNNSLSNPPPTPIRVGVVGVGYLGKFHAAKYAALAGVVLAGVVDTDPGRANAVAGELGVPGYADYAELFGRVDAVSVVTPTPSHYAISRSFLEQGVDVLIEKPITTTLAEADELIELAAGSHRIIQVGLLERFNPAVQAAQPLISNPRMLEARRLCIYKERCTDVSVVLDLMIHDIDLALALVPAPLSRIRAWGMRLMSPTADVARACLEFANGCVAHLSASRIAATNERTLQIHQNSGWLLIDCAERTVTQMAPSAPGCTVGEPCGPGLELTALDCPPADALEQELAAFVTCVRHRQAPRVSAQTGRQALAVALTIMEQMDAGN